jgi:alpha-ketoglutarate-dependent taurine dioxygenase
MNNNKQLLNKLETQGWVEIENITSDNDLITLSRDIGEIVMHPNGHLINRLRPNNGSEKIKGTLSNRFGFGNFPLHTDTAFWPIPVRFILFSSTAISLCPTFLVSTSSLFNQLNLKEFKEIERAIFKIKTPNNQFYSSLIFRENNTEGLKYDSACMIPVNKQAKFFVNKIEKSEISMDEIHWSGNKAVVIDNWKMLHARGPALVNENRELSRIYIN